MVKNSEIIINAIGIFKCYISCRFLLLSMFLINSDTKFRKIFKFQNSLSSYTLKIVKNGKLEKQKYIYVI